MSAYATIGWLPHKATALPPQARLPERQSIAIATPTGRPSWQLSQLTLSNPFLFVPQSQNLHLYEQLIQTVPVLNAAMSRIVQFVGCPEIESEDEVGSQDLEEWWDGVSVNRNQTGGDNWFAGWVMDHLTYGRAHAEIIPRADVTDIYALQELHTRTIDLRPKPDTYGLDVVQRQFGTGGLPVLLPPDLLLSAYHDVRNDSPQGNSLAFGLTFVGEIYEKLLHSLKETWERFGTPSYQVRWIPPDGFQDPTGAKSAVIASSLASTLQDVLKSRKEGKPRDFAAAGDVQVSIIGANGEALDIEIPGRHLVEQIVAKTGIPPFLLGLQWATTERMSQVQADLLSEMIDEIRGHLKAPILYLWRLRQALVGRPFEFDLCWEAPSLMDLLTTATAEKAQAEAESAKLKWLEREWTLGIRNELDVARERRPELAQLTDAEIRTKLPRLLAEPPAVPAPAFGAPPQDQTGQQQPAPSQPAALRSLEYGANWATNGNGRHK